MRNAGGHEFGQLSIAAARNATKMLGEVVLIELGLEHSLHRLTAGHSLMNSLVIRATAVGYRYQI